jgi:phosphate transport system substrate-binding protein
MLNIPLCISMQMVNYNLPGLNGKHLKLSGPVLAGMYSGTILYWDDAAIKALNPGVKLPHHAIIPVHRTDGSGDTFIFSQYLSFSTPSWSKSVGYGTTVSWPPVPGGRRLHCPAAPGCRPAAARLRAGSWRAPAHRRDGGLW